MEINKFKIISIIYEDIVSKLDLLSKEIYKNMNRWEFSEFFEIVENLKLSDCDGVDFTRIYRQILTLQDEDFEQKMLDIIFNFINYSYLKISLNISFDENFYYKDNQATLEKINPEKISQEKDNKERINQEKVNQEKVNPEKVNPENVNPEKVNKEKADPEKITNLGKFFGEIKKVLETSKSLDINKDISKDKDLKKIERLNKAQKICEFFNNSIMLGKKEDFLNVIKGGVNPILFVIKNLENLDADQNGKIENGKIKKARQDELSYWVNTIKQNKKKFDEYVKKFSVLGDLYGDKFVKIESILQKVQEQLDEIELKPYETIKIVNGKDIDSKEKLSIIREINNIVDKKEPEKYQEILKPMSQEKRAKFVDLAKAIKSKLNIGQDNVKYSRLEKVITLSTWLNGDSKINKEKQEKSNQDINQNNRPNNKEYGFSLKTGSYKPTESYYMNGDFNNLL